MADIDERFAAYVRRETPAGELPETVIADFADGQADAAQVRQVLQALPRQQRAVLVLRYFAVKPVKDHSRELFRTGEAGGPAVPTSYS